jgi:hypothetical protein
MVLNKKPDFNYRNTPLKLPWATFSSPPGTDGQLTHIGY